MLFKWDFKIFEWINTGMSSPLMDFFMPWLREPIFWLPLYVFLIAYVLFNFGKKSYWFILFTILTVSTSDMTSSRLIKKNVQRARPCHYVESHPDLTVIKRVRCGSGYSFTSSHATNHFAVATFLIMVLGIFLPILKPWLWVWAGMISLAQVYVGVHFPLDILAGALLGIFIGYIYARLFKHYYGHTIYDHLSSVALNNEQGTHVKT
jgi:undecaprenyl-diphosphatase